MKKTYIQPTMKVVEVQQRQMLCGSPDETMKVYGGETVDETETKEKFGSDYNLSAW